MELPEEQSRTPSPTRRTPAAALRPRRSILPDATSSALPRPLALLCLPTGAPKHPRHRRMESEMTLYPELPLRIQARHCHWGSPSPLSHPRFLPTAALSSCHPLHPDRPLPSLHHSTPTCRRKRFDCSLSRYSQAFAFRDSGLQGLRGLDAEVLGFRDTTSSWF